MHRLVVVSSTQFQLAMPVIRHASSAGLTKLGQLREPHKALAGNTKR